MNKIFKIFKRRIPCINGRADHEMVNLSQFSPRVTRSKSKKTQEKVAAECEPKKTDAEAQKKTRNVGLPREKKKSKKKAGEMNSVRASRGSVGTMSLNQTPKTLDEFPTATKLASPKHLEPPSNRICIKSPPIGTISADTPERSSRFHKNILNVAECKLRILGKGSFGTIIQATYKGELVAAKIVPPHKTDSLKNELNNFLLSHPNIVKTLRIISAEQNHSCGLVIMEMYSSITLEHLCNEDSYPLDVKSIVRYMTDIGGALDYCHKQKVLHLDVKPQNILVNVTTNVCKLCDFGSSCLYSGMELSLNSPDNKTLQSTVVYTSPELLTGGSPTEKSDVYSFGITLWQIIHKEKPYDINMLPTYSCVKSGKVNVTFNITAWLFGDDKLKLPLPSKENSFNGILKLKILYNDKIVKQKKRPQIKVKTNASLEQLYTICWEHEPDRRPTMEEVITSLEKIQIT